MHKHLNSCIIIILLILLVLSTASCSESDTPQSDVFDSKNENVLSIGRKVLFPIAEANDVIYFCPTFMDHGNLWFYDLKDGYAAPFCAKPDCQHDSETCGAYFMNSTLKGISVYDNKLWYTAIGPSRDDPYSRIYWQELNGGPRNQRHIFTNEEISEATGDGRSFFYGGYYLKSGSGTEVIDEVPFRPARVIAYDLETDERIEILNKRFDMFSEVCIEPFDKWLYISVCGLNLGDEEQSFTLYRWNLETRELEELYSGKVGHQFTEMWVEDDRVFLVDNTSPDVYCYSMDSGTFSLAWTANINDERWLFYCFSEDSIIFQKADPRGLALKIMDFSGNTVAQHSYDYKKGSLLFFDCGADDQYAYRMEYPVGGKGGRLLAIPLDGSEIKTLWSN